MRKVIIDSDWGGDVLQLASILLSRKSEYELLGATVVFGNAGLSRNVANAGAILRLLGVDDRVKRFAGLSAPDGESAPPEGDEAHGASGLGDVELEASQVAAAESHAVDFLLETIEREEPGTVTLVATGPQSNVARAIRNASRTMARLKEIRIMGGCVRPMAGFRVNAALDRVGEDGIERKGNITEFAEFNFQQAPEDARTVLKSGIQVALFPMDCTHQLTFTREREARLRGALGGNGQVLEQLVGLLKAPEKMDRAKFGCSPVMHDVHTTVSLLRPDLYEGRKGRVRIETQGERAGETFFEPDGEGPHWVAEGIRNPDAVFDILVDAFRKGLR